MNVEVAKALGWVQDGAAAKWSAPGDSMLRHTEPSYTADDLLSWLRGHGTALYDAEDRFGFYSVVLRNRDGAWFGPTLLEALELAVLAVVGASS